MVWAPSHRRENSWEERSCRLEFSLDNRHHSCCQAGIVFLRQMVEIDSDGYTLLDFDKIACRVVSRNKRVLGTSSTRDGGNGSFEGFTAYSIYTDSYLLAYIKVLYLFFLIIGNNPFFGMVCPALTAWPSSRALLPNLPSQGAVTTQ